MPYKDPAKQKCATARHYANNKVKYIDRNTLRRQERRKWFDNAVLKGLRCERCGEDHPATLDFHHKDASEKSGEVSDMLNGLRSKQRILAEVRKCIVLCANCHRKLHLDNRKEDYANRRTSPPMDSALGLLI